MKMPMASPESSIRFGPLHIDSLAASLITLATPHQSSRSDLGIFDHCVRFLILTMREYCQLSQLLLGRLLNRALVLANVGSPGALVGVSYIRLVAIETLISFN